ncbi:DUF3052 family protein [Parerythrobacter jejuensis]|uniref:DUF3052 family protein n=1 Tax=Parerythrobacter jejuensis TaxID=795812 RepID=A0A845ASA2_9SPHN|nr:DUF3052 family protein [Parerythrobacter jejuensis]MXP32257.1 DUF3052 family protein [Parerythrobacter jejuensis]
MTAGYSDTPLAKKLSLRDEQRVWFDAMPENIADEIDEYALELIFVGTPDEGIDAAHIFVTGADDLANKLASLRQHIAKDGQVWVSWPKKGSGQETALDQAEVQSIGIASGFIDTKKCAVDEIWSGLKFVIPKEDR